MSKCKKYKYLVNELDFIKYLFLFLKKMMYDIIYNSYIIFKKNYKYLINNLNTYEV